MSDLLVAPPRRTDAGTVEKQAGHILKWTGLRTFVDAIPDVLLAVNSTRQIVFANAAALVFLQAKEASEIIGKRPGEAAGCVHSAEVPGGCGEAAACRVCGALRAIMLGLEGKKTVEECRMTLANGAALDLRLWVKPFNIRDEAFVFISIRDIGDEKRLHALEKIFFHDILNTAGGIQSVSEIMENSGPEEFDELRSLMATLSGQLVEEIRSQRELVAAERGELHVEMQPVNSRDVINRVIESYLLHPSCEGKTIRADETCEAVGFLSDPALLLRILGNLVKNALEASRPTGLVTIGCRTSGPGTVEFVVRNEGVIAPAEQLQIFNRSFSTKGAGRGLGTYSVKLLAERFLRGRARFVSTPATQTAFFVELPLKV